MLHQFRSFFFMIATGFVTALVALPNTSALASETKVLKLGLNWKPEPQFGGFYNAEIKGHFKNENLKVQIFEGGSGTPTIQMVALGQLDYGIVSADEVILSHDRGAKDIVALFAVYQTNPQGFLVHQDHPAKSLQELLATDGILLWQKGLPYAQYIQKKWKIKRTQAPYTGGIANYLNDKKVAQQCFVTSEPLAAEDAKQPGKTFLVAESGYNPYTTVVVTQRSRFEKNPKEVQAMVRAIRQGWVDYLQSPEPAHRSMSSLNKAMSLDLMNRSALAQKPLIETTEAKGPSLGVMSLQRWQDLENQLYDLKIIKQKGKAESYFLNLK